MENMHIREIHTEDSVYVQKLSEQLGYPCSGEKMKERIQFVTENTDDIIFVAQLEEKVIGYIHGSPYELLHADSLINLMAFVVDEEYRSIGVGSELLEHMEQYAKIEGYAGVRLVSRIDRMDAHKFYENHGYICRKEQKNFIKLFEG